jgi:hypothetical protein
LKIVYSPEWATYAYLLLFDIIHRDKPRRYNMSPLWGFIFSLA